MSAHTPGPWSYRGSLGPHSNEYLKGPHVVENATGIQVCILNGWRSDVSEANAKLIAASPDLYAACETALALLTGDGRDGTKGEHKDNPVPAMLRAALAKVSP